MTTAAQPSKHLTYGNWFARQSPGIGPFGTIGTIILLLGSMVGVFTGIVLNIFLGLGVFAALALVLLPFVWKQQDRNLWQLTLARVAWRRGVAKGQDLYLTQLLGTQHLPGLLADTELHEFTTTSGLHIGLIHHRAARTYSVMLRVQPQGSNLVDQQTVDLWVAHYGAWLASQAVEPALLGATVTIETSPDPGNRLALEVEHLIRPGTPQLAQDMLREAAASYPRAAAVVDAWVTLVYTARRGRVDGDDRAFGQQAKRREPLRSPAEIAALVASRLGGMMASLSMSGAGTAIPMSSRDIIDLVRVAYDPASATAVDELRVSGETSPVTWEQAGPPGAREAWAAYQHGDAASVSWLLDGPPTSDVDSRVLAQLLAPHHKIARKRVTLFYRAYSPAAAVGVVDAQHRTATGRAGRKASTKVHEQRAEDTATAQARGAGVTRFSGVITATVASPQDLPDATETVGQLGPGARLSIRRAYGSQSAAFTLGLGLGVIANEYVYVPTALRDYA